MKFWNNFMLFLSDKTLAVPFGQVVFFVFFISLSLLFGRYKLGLLISFTFVFRWGFVFNHEYFFLKSGDTSIYFFIYGFSGMIASILLLIGSIKEGR